MYLCSDSFFSNSFYDKQAKLIYQTGIALSSYLSGITDTSLVIQNEKTARYLSDAWLQKRYILQSAE